MEVSTTSAGTLRALRRLVRALRLADRAAETRLGLSAAQLFVLERLSEGPVGSMAELAGRTLTDASSVSVVVHRLAQRGLVVRAVAADDARRTTLRLSASGKRLLGTAPRSPQADLLVALEQLSGTERKELEQLLEMELEVHHQEAEAPAMALMKSADALPGFGIVAAVLGIVTTMSQLSGDTSRIGEHIAGALVGTFLGILLCYGFAGPLASAMENRAQEDGKAFECVKVALMANLRGYNPMVSVEFARKSLVAQVRPSFMELEGHLKGARAGAGA